MKKKKINVILNNDIAKSHRDLVMIMSVRRHPKHQEDN